MSNIHDSGIILKNKNLGWPKMFLNNENNHLLYRMVCFFKKKVGNNYTSIIFYQIVQLPLDIMMILFSHDNYARMRQKSILCYFGVTGVHIYTNTNTN